jgi:hypothetical protein
MKPSHDRWSAEVGQPIAACKSLNPVCPKATDSKAPSAPTPSGFAFVPHTCRAPIPSQGMRQADRANGVRGAF